MTLHTPAPDSGARAMGTAVDIDFAAGLAVFIRFAIENDQSGVDIMSFEKGWVRPVPSVARHSRARFLANLVTVEGAMITPTDPGRMLSSYAGDGNSTRVFDA